VIEEDELILFAISFSFDFSLPTADFSQQLSAIERVDELKRVVKLAWRCRVDDKAAGGTGGG
jgi:hypothetical protein